MTRLDEAKQILEVLGFDAARSNDRSGRTLLALARLTEASSWADATNTRLGVRAILDWIREELDFPVAENTRETYRRQTLHQFRDAGFVILNEDDPSRATNSSLNNYKLTDAALSVLRAFGTREFDDLVNRYLEDAPGLLAIYRAERDLTRIPVTLPGGVDLTLGAGGQNVLIKQMIDDFCAYFIRAERCFTSAMLTVSSCISMRPSSRSWASWSTRTASCQTLLFTSRRRTGCS